MENAPLVTVVITTYNQEHTIARAIDSVLAQKTDFPFEIYISEDCGSDGTRALLLRYAARWPHLIRLNLRQRNVGISRNWYEALCAAKGDYVCTLEGDDWWIDDHKLQKQVDFLKAHPDCFAVSHTIQLTDNAGVTYGCLPDSPLVVGRYATMEHFLQGLTYSCTACLVKNFFDINDKKTYQYVTANRSIADFALCMLYLDKGPVYVMDEALSAYRVSSPTQTHQNYNTTQSDTKKYADFLDVVAQSRNYFGDKYDFNTCLLSGTFFPFLDRIHMGGMAAFLKQMRRLPPAVKLRFPFYTARRTFGLLTARIKRSMHR